MFWGSFFKIKSSFVFLKWIIPHCYVEFTDMVNIGQALGHRVGGTRVERSSGGAL